MHTIYCNNSSIVVIIVVKLEEMHTLTYVLCHPMCSENLHMVHNMSMHTSYYNNSTSKTVIRHFKTHMAFCAY